MPRKKKAATPTVKKYAASDADISDEELYIYILDPEEVEERKQATMTKKNGGLNNPPSNNSITLVLSEDFPALSHTTVIKKPHKEGRSDENYGEEEDQRKTTTK